MSATNEIDVLKKLIDDLAPLEPDARQRVVDYACKMLAINHLQSPISVKEGVRQNQSAGTQSNKPTAPQQYLRNYNYKIMTKRIAVMAVYLERERGVKRFNFRDITDAFRDAKEAKTPAQSQYARAVIMGYLAKEGDQFYATSKAEELVDAYNARETDETSE
jgi:hypothetical protein